MSPLQRRIAAIADTTANLIAQLSELEELREQVREALLSANGAPRLERRNETGAMPPGLFESIARVPGRSRIRPPRSTATVVKRTLLS
jgi:hypothetical protein